MKKSKKIIASLITIIVLVSVVGVIFYTSSYADGEKMYLAAAVLNPKTGTGYAVKDPTHARIWNFLEYPDQNATLTQNDIRPNYYCLKAGVGFTSEIDQDTLITTTPIEYSVKYDMKTQKDDMLSKNDATINSIVNGTIENSNGDNISKYSALLALLDLLYYPTTSNTDWDEDAKAFLESAGIFTEEYLESNLLKNEDIRAVQQAAIWYFTNYGETVGSEENFYDNTGDSEIATWLYYSTNGKDYNALYSTSANRSARAIQAQTLYNYLVETAKDNASQYDNGGNNSEPVKVTQTPNYEANGNNYILGPIKIETDSIANPTISLEVKNGQNNISYTLLDESKKTISNNNINEVIGKNFYISIPKSDVTNVTVNVNYSYTEKNLTLWTNEGGTTQPILVPDTTNKQGTTTINFEIEKTEVTVNKKWDDNNDQDGARTAYAVTLTGKVENKTVYTDTQTLNTETTYTWSNLDKYSAGQEIEYTVDETKIPTDYEKQVTGSAETGFTITNTHEPEKTSVKVTKIWDDNNDQDKIRGEYSVTIIGKVGNEEVYTDTQTLGADKLEYTWNNLDKYKNGQEIVYTVDETKIPDGYEKEVTGSATEGFKITNKHKSNKTFDLALRKYITQVTTNEVTTKLEDSSDLTRTPNIDTSNLVAGSTAGAGQTTATYKHRKDPVEVKTGSEVIYNITVYNEGETLGRATEIIDQLPTGVEFVEVVSGGYTANYDKASNKLTLTKTGTNNLAANTNGNLSSETIQIKVKVTANAGSTNKVLTNIAWISKEVKVDANGTETEVTNQKGIDRDSEPETITTKTADELVTEDTGYTGNDSNSEKDLSNKDSYFEGQQDDDDFEKIIIKATTSVSVTKVWNDNNDQDGIRPDSVSVSLLANDVVKETVTLNEANGWSHTFTNLPVEDENGTVITYTVKENDVPTGYEANVTKDTTETTSISGTQNTAQSIYRVTNTYESVRTFDLALRKYITQVTTDGITTNLETDTNLTRTPNIDTSNLVAGSTAGADQTTAIYKHKKDPVEVKTGSEVIYNITVYNEGEKQGRATEIIDQLPKGLEFMEVVSGDYSANYDKDSNKLTLTKTGTNNLAVNKDGNLSSETIQIKAKVTATVGNTDKVLTNIAWISKEVKVDENGTETEVTNEKGIDRDSEPGTITTKTQDELVTSDTGYIGSNANSSKDLSSKDSYFEGQQDDDDFEKVILKKAEGTYEIQLLKVDSENVNKTLSGAEFKITLPDGTTKNVTTDEQGKITISGINITNEGIDTITIEETKAPTDYEKMVDSFTLQVTKKIQNGNYIVTEANLTNSQNGVTVALNGNTINVMVLNEEIQKPVDFKLIKRIVSVNDENVPERIEKIDVSNLNLLDSDGNLLSDGTEKYTTAEYSLNKEPVLVKKGDIVTYTFRVYNEGLVNGYVQEITEDIPEGLEFLWSNKQGTDLENDETLTDAEKEAIKFNQDNLWVISKQDENDKVIEIKTDYLSQENGTIEDGTNSNLIEAFGENDGTKTAQDLHYKEVSVKLKVIAENITGTVIRNEAAITDDLDEDGNEVEDRDSKPEEWPGKDDHDNYQDDEDYDNIKLQSFDLALRKYIAAVSHDTTIEDSEYLRNEDGSYTRAPKVDTSKLNTEDENGNIITTATYNHTKEPVLIQPNDVIVYHLRVYNEGEIDGYAAEIKDHLPPYLEFVESEFNNQYGWKVSDDGRTVTTNYLESEDKIIKAATTNEDGTIVLSYQEVPIMCKVIDTAPTSQNITNIADITKYLDNERKDVTDRDSQEDNVELPKDEDLPNYKEDENGSYVPGQQDDDDFEKVIIKKFDLSLRKWVTEAIVIENGAEKITATGHEPYDDPEQIVKVELHRKKINQVEVKFRYSIRVTNEGEIAGYAKEITDYIPEGLKFVEEDNQNWKDEGNNVISTTQLADTLLQPGEYKDIEVILTWVNNENNMGVMTNTAEISEDYNEYEVPDIDSTPDNQKEGEDDIDDAPVMLSVSTGQMRIYFTLGFIILITLAGGVVLIKKHVLGEN